MSTGGTSCFHADSMGKGLHSSPLHPRRWHSHGFLGGLRTKPKAASCEVRKFASLRRCAKWVYRVLSYFRACFVCFVGADGISVGLFSNL